MPLPRGLPPFPPDGFAVWYGRCDPTPWRARTSTMGKRRKTGKALRAAMEESLRAGDWYLRQMELATRSASGNPEDVKHQFTAFVAASQSVVEPFEMGRMGRKDWYAAWGRGHPADHARLQFVGKER